MCPASIKILMVLVTNILCQDVFATENNIPAQMFFRDLPPYATEEQYIRSMHSIINAHRSEKLGPHLVIETDSMVNTKYRTWKRNLDYLNSILLLPKGMGEVGR